MFQLWKFVLLCGLLTGTSAGIIENLGNSLSGIVNGLKPVLNNGLQDIENILQNLRTDLNTLQDTNAWQTMRGKFQEAKSFLNDALSKIFSSDGLAVGLTITNVHILAMKAQPTPDGQGLLLRIPTSADVGLTLPLTGQALNLNASLDIMATIKIETDPESGASRVVLTNCSSNPDSISFALLGRHSTLVNSLTDTLSNLLSKTVSFVIQNQICSVVSIFVPTLDPKFVQNIINNNEPGTEVPIIA